MTKIEYEFMVIHQHLDEIEKTIALRISLIKQYVDKMQAEVLERQGITK